MSYLTTNFLTLVFGFIILIDVVVIAYDKDVDNTGLNVFFQLIGAKPSYAGLDTGVATASAISALPFVFLAYGLLVSAQPDPYYRNIALLTSIIALGFTVVSTDYTTSVWGRLRAQVALPLAQAAFAVIPIVLYNSSFQ